MEPATRRRRLRRVVPTRVTINPNPIAAERELALALGSYFASERRIQLQLKVKVGIGFEIARHSLRAAANGRTQSGVAIRVAQRPSVVMKDA